MTGRVPADDVLNNAVGDKYFSLKSTYFGLPEERLSSGLQGRMEGVFAPALSSMALAQNSVLANQPDQVARCLESVAACIVKCAHVFDAMTPRDTANFDPVVWIKTYPAMGRAVTSGELGNSGVDAPLFHALDVFIGRQQVKGDLRGMQSDRRATLPTNIRAFLDALGDDAGSVRDYVAAARAQLEHVPSEEQAQYKHLSAAWDGLLQLYVWFLERHRVKAVGITGITLNTGRHSTSSGVKSGDQDKAMKDGKPKMRPEAMLSMQMKKGMVSRLGGRPLWQDAHVQSHSVYRGSVVVAVKLDATLPLEPGDRVQIWPPRKRKTLNRASSHHRRLRGSPCPEDHDTSSGETDDDGEPRFYSIARVIPNVSGAAMDSVGGAGGMTIILTVAQHSPEGLVSSFLSSAAPGTHLRLRPWPSPRFRQPRDLAVPLVLVGQGVGIGPLVGFLHDRATKKQRLDDTQNESAGEGELLLVVAAKTLRHVPCSLDSLEELTSRLPLTIVLALSQESHLKIRGGIWTKLPQGGRRVTRHLTDYRDFIQRLVKEKKATTELGRQTTTAKLFKALVRMQNALTNNTAFDAGRGSVPTYAYEDSLLVFADGLDGLICSLSDFGTDKSASDLRETISNTQASLRNAFKALKDGSKRFLMAAGTKGASASSSTLLDESEALIQRLHRKPIERLHAAMNACKKGISEAEVGMNADSNAKLTCIPRNATVDCNQDLYQWTVNADSVWWTAENTTQLCTESCLASSRQWKEDVADACVGEWLRSGRSYVEADTLSGRFAEGLELACTRSSADECRMANLYDDDLLCSECFLKLLHTRIESEFLPDEDHSDYLVEQFQDIQNVCQTTLVADISTRKLPAYPTADIPTPTESIATAVSNATDPVNGAQLAAWNPNILGACDYLVPDHRPGGSWIPPAIESLPDSSEGPVRGGPGSTPTLEIIDNPSITIDPWLLQEGLAADCTRYVLANAGANCWKIANDAGVEQSRLFELNPVLGASGEFCDTKVWRDYYYCVGVNGEGSPTTTSAPPAATTTSAVPRPTYSYCIGIGSTSSPAPTTTKGADPAKPMATQAGIAANCNNFVEALSGDGCWKLANDAGIELSLFYQWNTVLEYGAWCQRGKL
ncbi:hypothetical protein K4K60_002110 [Colletotrichum sp. SAR11_57]|nr:hypothetical protein K4K60_002110 [Colletotrichum sp. SAR11_57]